MSEGHPLSRILSRVQKPGRYVGGEWNAIKKKPESVDLKVGLVFPDVYEIGMSYIGQKILYGLLNRDERVLAERVFAPWPDFESELRKASLPLISLENSLPLREFDILGFSLLYELNYSNVLTILDLGGVPLLSAERERGDPLVIAGGPCAFNPEPVADIFDAFLLGDGEEAFPEIVDTILRYRGRSASRRDLLETLAQIEGVYVPSLYTVSDRDTSFLLVPLPGRDAPPQIKKRLLVETFSQAFFPEDIVVPNLRVVFDRVALEAARGCPENCRFCQASSVYFPHRPRDPRFLIETMVNSLRQTGYEDSSLSALSIGDHPYLEETVRRLMNGLSEEKISLSLSSLRPGRLSRDLVKDILRVRKTGFTLVPEAGTERLRSVINKKITNREIEDALRFAFEAGWKLIKFYFMCGLPTEKDEDLSGIVALIQESLALGRSILGTSPRIHVSLSSFIPKPHTAFQWLAMDDEKVLIEKQRAVRKDLGRARTIEFKDHPIKSSLLEAVFSRGDRRLTRVLLRAWSSGARFDSWRDTFDFSLWETAFRQENIDYHNYLKALERDQPLPWGHVDTGLRESYHQLELDRALQGLDSPSCLEKSCQECGGCEIPKRKTIPPPIKTVLPPLKKSWRGTAGSEVLRYRVRYSKKGTARYLSHIDLIHVLQRSFKRAGVPVRLTQGFHPKPDFTYGPALSLGIEGLREILEFRSLWSIDEKTFLNRINRCVPPGIQFRKLARLPQKSLPLGKSVEALVYSWDWRDEEFLTSWDEVENSGGAKGDPLTKEMLGKALEDVRRREFGTTFSYRLRENRIILRIPQSGPSRKPPRPQDIIKEALGIENPGFFLRRNDIRLKSEVAGPEIDRKK